MKFLLRIILSVLANVAAFIVTAHFLMGFKISYDFKNLLIAGIVFALINLLIRPVFKFFFMPAIILTLGLGIIVVNAAMLYLLTIFTNTVIIQGTLTLVLATFIIGLVNLAAHL